MSDILFLHGNTRNIIIVCCKESIKRREGGILSVARKTITLVQKKEIIVFMNVYGRPNEVVKIHEPNTPFSLV